ncbi:unnamed protein product [Durusdinium trenchii]|uniref:Uncharacterized protein n=1 Tax=Durusdinium trenchii TaxID=1381693 RepID=A0ABP0MRB1_9DINO
MAQPVDPFAKWRLLTTPSEQFKDCTPSGSELRFSFFLKEVLRHPLSFEDFIDFRRSNSFLRENTSKKSHGFDAAAFRTDFASQLENQASKNDSERMHWRAKNEILVLAGDRHPPCPLDWWTKVMRKKPKTTCTQIENLMGV